MVITSAAAISSWKCVDFLSLAETLRPNVLLKIIKSQYALCIISKPHYGCSLLRGWVCLWGLLSFVGKSAVLLVIHCQRYLGTYRLSPVLPYTNRINFFYFRDLTPKGILVWSVLAGYPVLPECKRFSSIYSSMCSLYSAESVCRVWLKTPCIHRLVDNAILLFPYLWLPN